MAFVTLLFVLTSCMLMNFFYYCLSVLSCGRTKLHPSPTSHVFTNALLTVPVGINISNFCLIKIIFGVILLIRLLISAYVIVVSSVRFIPFNLNLNSRPKTLWSLQIQFSNRNDIFSYTHYWPLLTQVLSFSFLIKRYFNWSLPIIGYLETPIMYRVYIRLSKLLHLFDY